MRAEKRFKSALEKIIAGGEYPSPARIREALGQDTQPNNLSGRECKWREEFLLERGWKRVSTGPGTRAFEPAEAIA